MSIDASGDVPETAREMASATSGPIQLGETERCADGAPTAPNNALRSPAFGLRVCSWENAMLRLSGILRHREPLRSDVSDVLEPNSPFICTSNSSDPGVRGQNVTNVTHHHFSSEARRLSVADFHKDLPWTEHLRADGSRSCESSNVTRRAGERADKTNGLRCTPGTRASAGGAVSRGPPVIGSPPTQHSTKNVNGPGAEDAEAEKSPRKMIVNSTSTLTQSTLQNHLQTGAAFHRNQAQIAFEFALEHKGQFLFVRNMDWMAYNGKRWVSDAGLTQDALLRTLRRLRAEGQTMLQNGAANHDEIMEKRGKNLLSIVLSCESASGLTGVLKIASNLQGMTATVDELDAEAYLMNTPECTIDLRTLQARPHDPADLITKITRGSYDPANPARSPLWDGFLDQVLPDPAVRRFFQRVMGLALIGEVVEHIFTILSGTGRNGKGVTYTTIMHALGDYAAVAEDGLFEVQRGGNSQGASPRLAKLRGVRFLVASELEEKARVSASFMKRMTGGDRITARELYGAPFEFWPAFLILMITNFLPKLPANDPATWARVRVVPFNVVIPKDMQDPQLGSKLKNEADAVLAWAMEGLADYFANGLDEPTSVVAATQAYAESQDDVRRFIDARCTDATSGGDTTTDLLNAYQDWASDEGIHQAHVLGRTKFGEALDKLGFAATRTNRGAVRLGLLVDTSAA